MDTPTIPEPILLTPRLDAKPWGSTNLSRFGIDLGGEQAIGEAVLTSDDVLVADGRFAGRSLADLIALNPEGLLGRRGYLLGGAGHHFPLLAKLIDAVEPLSIQVHPTDDIAPEGHLGKTEAWYVLAAEPGAVVWAGLIEGATKADVAAALANEESLEPLIRSLPVQPGEVLFLPAGTIHALGAGVVIYEIQQPSFVTYRLQDWGRAREMHVEAGLAALNDTLRPEPTWPPIRTPDSNPQPAVQCPQFAFEQIQIPAGTAVVLPPEGEPQVVTCIAGEAELIASREDVTLTLGATAVLFASAGPARISSLSGAKVLRAWVGH